MQDLATTSRYLAVRGTAREQTRIAHSPFAIGRSPDSDLVIADPLVSRKHAEVLQVDGEYLVQDVGSRHGTFLNGCRVTGPMKLKAGDSIRVGGPAGPELRFSSSEATATHSIRQMLGALPDAQSRTSDLEKLRWFVEAARRLSTTDAVDQILSALLETTLELTRGERACVFLCNDSGTLEFALGRNSKGEPLFDDGTLSHSALREAECTGADYLATDPELTMASSESMVHNHILSVLCVPLRRARLVRGSCARDLLGVLYIDSRITTTNLSSIDADLLRTIANDAASLVHNWQLAAREENARRDREELQIAAAIQRSLMTIDLPNCSYAKVAARSIPSLELGGDFFDVIAGANHLSVVVADVSGKGISAAVLAATLQGILHAQLVGTASLSDIVAGANSYLCDRKLDKFATLSILRLSADGRVEYINCGQIPPIAWTGSELIRLAENCVPVGLYPDAVFQASEWRALPGTRVLLVTDGITEARKAGGEFFEEDRLETCVKQGVDLDGILTLVHEFCGGELADDDRTVVDLYYAGE